MALAVVQAGNNSGGGSSGTFTSALTAGNTVLLVVQGYASNAALSSSAPKIGGAPVTGASLLTSAQANPTGNTVYTGTWMLPAVSGGQTTCSVTFTGGTCIGLFWYEVSGLGASPALDKSNSGTSANGTANSGASGAITAAPEIVLGASVGYSLSQNAPSSPWVSQSQFSAFCWAAYQIVTSSGGSYTYSQTATGTAPVAATVDTIKGTAAAASGPEPYISQYSGYF